MSKSKTQSSLSFSGLLLRLFITFTVLLLAMVVIVPIAAYLFLNPNEHKAEIANFITERTGLPLEIHGAIDLKLFPWVGLNVKNVHLPQPPNYGDDKFIQIEEIGFKIPPKELLQRHLKIETLMLKGLTVHFVKNADGSTNWDHYAKRVKNLSSSDETPQNKNESEKTTAAQKSKKKLTFALENFDLQKGAFIFDDNQVKQIFTLNKIEITGKHDESQIYAINCSYDLLVNADNPKSILTSGKGGFNGKLNFKDQPLANLHAHANLQFPNNPASFKEAQIKMQVSFDPNRSIAIKDIEVSSGATEIKGIAAIPMDSRAPITFNVGINQLNLDALNASDDSQTNKNAKSSPSGVAAKGQSATNKKGAPGSRTIEGEVRIQQVTAKNMTLKNIKAMVKKENTTLKVNSLVADFYQGKLNAQISQDLAKSGPINFQGKLLGLQIEPLLKDLRQTAYVTGKADIEFNMAHSLQGLNGTTQIYINNGTLNGIDVKYYLNVAQSLLKKEQPDETNRKYTPFDKLSGTFQFNNNLIYNNDLLLLASNIKATGDGSINLNNQTLEYKLNAVRQYDDGQEHPNAYPLAIRVRGPFSHPNVEPDMDTYLKAVVEREMKKQLNKQIEKHIGKIFGKNNKENDEAAPESSDGANPIQEKLEKEIGKGLKKLFKK